MFQLESNYLRHSVRAWLGRPSSRHPLLAYVYLTYRCNLRCSYCDDGTGVSYPDRPRGRELSTDDALRLLAIVRHETDGIIFTGGEPLMRPDLEPILRGVRALGYRTVALLTNGYALDERWDVLDHVGMLMVSLDTLDTAQGDGLYRRGPGVSARILRNIDRAILEQRRRDFTLYFNVCITPDNIAALHPVIDFAVARRVGLVPIPVLQGQQPPAALRRSEAYRSLIDRLIALKRSGFPVLGTLAYLRRIRDFSPYRCQPALLVRIKPDGHLLYPCNKLNLEGGNLLELGSYDAALAVARARHGAVVSCERSCPEGCYMDFSLCIQHPTLALEESYYRAKSWLVHEVLHRPLGASR